MDEAQSLICPGCGDSLGTNYDCCGECSLEVAFDEVCPTCGWGVGSNTSCGECAEVAAREQEF